MHCMVTIINWRIFDNSVKYFCFLNGIWNYSFELDINDQICSNVKKKCSRINNVALLTLIILQG